MGGDGDPPTVKDNGVGGVGGGGSGESGENTRKGANGDVESLSPPRKMAVDGVTAAACSAGEVTDSRQGQTTGSVAMSARIASKDLAAAASPGRESITTTDTEEQSTPSPCSARAAPAFSMRVDAAPPEARLSTSETAATTNSDGVPAAYEDPATAENSASTATPIASKPPVAEAVTLPPAAPQTPPLLTAAATLAGLNSQRSAPRQHNGLPWPAAACSQETLFAVARELREYAEMVAKTRSSRPSKVSSDPAGKRSVAGGALGAGAAAGRADGSAVFPSPFVHDPPPEELFDALLDEVLQALGD